MTDERFIELLRSPALAPPFLPFRIARLANALRAVLAATGERGDLALEDFCRTNEGRIRAARDEEAQSARSSSQNEG